MTSQSDGDAGKQKYHANVMTLQDRRSGQSGL